MKERANAGKIHTVDDEIASSREMGAQADDNHVSKQSHLPRSSGKIESIIFNE